jgi:predicted ArsR family transcriptional regulator
MTEALTTESNFVKPYYIEELGEDGLTAADIAKSLDIRADAVRQKLISRGFLERLTNQGFLAATIVVVNKNNGLEYSEYFLSVSAAKFFVTKYDSDKGDAYAAFLIKLEKKVTDEQALIASDPLLQEIAAIHKLRVSQMQHEQRLTRQEWKTLLLEEDSGRIHESILDSILSIPQKQRLIELMDSQAKAAGDLKFSGYMKRDLKKHFNLNATNDKWYHLPQRSYQDAVNFVSTYFMR